MNLPSEGGELMCEEKVLLREQWRWLGPALPRRNLVTRFCMAISHAGPQPRSGVACSDLFGAALILVKNLVKG